MSYQLITTNKELNEYCQILSHAKYVSLDSEFIRTRSYYPHLGLLQLFDGNNIVLIDPLQINDWQKLVAELSDPNKEYYFHACSEDLEVFQHHFNFIPTPILDSQILASFLDNPLSTGYATLVKKYLDIDLDKSETRTDWLKRPLTDRQLHYAANDVYYLTPLMEKLRSAIFDKGWLNAAYLECSHIIKKKSETVSPDKAYLHIKNAWQLKSSQLFYMKKLAGWRLLYAKEHDVALNFVVHEEILWKFARYQPKSLAEMSALGLKGKEIRLHGEQLQAIMSLPVEEVEPIRRTVNYSDYKHWATLIKRAAEEIAQKTGLSVELLVARRHIDQFVKWQHQEIQDKPELLSGWRKELFESYLIK